MVAPALEKTTTPPVIRLYDLHVRLDAAVKSGVQLLLLEKGPDPEIFRLQFVTKSEAKVWDNTLNSAIEECREKGLKAEYFSEISAASGESSDDQEEISVPLEEERHIKAVQNAMENKGILDHTIVHGVFVGLARSGKDSLMKRLLGKKLSIISPSTGVAESTVQVKVLQQPSTTIAANIEELCWSEMDYNDEAIKLMSISAHCKLLSLKQLQLNEFATYQEGILVEASVIMPECDRQDKGLVISSADSTATSHDAGMDQAAIEYQEQTDPLSSEIIRPPVASDVFIPNPLDILIGALQSKGLENLKQHFQKTWSLYLTNTGGQMEFQEVLPLLVSGPSMFFFTFRLDRDLNEYYSIEYELASGGKSHPYTATCTTIQGILQTLASISAMGTFIYQGLQKKQAPLRPRVFFIGTHKDKLDPDSAASHIASVDKQLQEVINSTSHSKELIEFAFPDQLIFTVNNFSKSEADFQYIRSAVERVVMRGKFQMTSPAHWLIFSLALRKLDSPVISYDLCFEIAKQCGITSQEELNEALHFIHSKMGVIRYFPYEDVKNIVIINPQFLFNKVTELIVDTFTFEKVGKSKMEEFKHNGIFSMEEFELINDKSQHKITSSQFGKLLIHLRIVAPFQVTETGEKKLFFPCVLAHAKTSTETSLQFTPVSSLLIAFDCGYIPKGVPGALITYLMTNEMRSSTEWILLTDEIFRDQISFSVGPYDTIVIKIFPTHFEISCIPDEQFMDDRASPIEETCNEVLKAINAGIPQILKDLNYIKGQHNVTFQCTAPNCKYKYKTQVLMDKSGCSGTLLCQIAKKRFRLPANSYYWGFGKKPCQDSGTRNATQPSIRSQNTQITSMHTHETASNIQHTELHILQAEESTNTQAASSGNHGQISLREGHHSILFEQLNKHSSDWMKIGIYLGFLPGELRTIQSSPSLFFDGSDGWLCALLEKWLQWAPGDNRGSKNFATLENLKSALLKAGFGATAHSLHI